MASSHLLGAGVSDNLGVPSVSLLSEDAVASESVRGGGQVSGGGSCLPQKSIISTLWKGSRDSDSPVGVHNYSGEPTHSPQLLKMRFTTDFYEHFLPKLLHDST